MSFDEHIPLGTPVIFIDPITDTIPPWQGKVVGISRFGLEEINTEYIIEMEKDLVFPDYPYTHTVTSRKYLKIINEDKQ